MKLTRAISIGILIWIIGVSLYASSFYVPLLEDAEQQANIWLSIVIVPVVWYGAKLYYRNNINTHGLRVGLIFFIISAVLDALITVPFTVLPYGGTYSDFFIDFGFWFIGLEFITTTTLYWYLKVLKKKSIQHI
ncbi:hypothetical protein EJ994_11160 [Maribacter sp. MJ134]|uniref:DUF5367 family protein n=1 Tax=Maribacter sp. MJ134 TaxID=2496865 RepID=UPI000F830AEE|nr:DUF5367 family protein [Maribacter sp. MJ134]AZQ59339.1 hypothetical protein EJ994_11160 [Maribacter sp. MJ134]